VQNVLRELEQKKPQLDELVQTAESIKDGGPPTGKQLPAQGKYLFLPFSPFVPWVSAAEQPDDSASSLVLSIKRR
jgi:hypothetical protein